MPAPDLVIPEVHPALLLLAQSVVMLVRWRVECGRYRVALRADVLLSKIRALRGHRPVTHVQQHLAVRRRDEERIVEWTLPAAKVGVAQLTIQRIQRHRLRQFLSRKISWRYSDNDPARAKDLTAVCIALVRPSLSRRICHKTIARSAGRPSLDRAHRYAQNVGSIRLERNHSSISLQHKWGTLRDRHAPNDTANTTEPSLRASEFQTQGRPIPDSRSDRPHPLLRPESSMRNLPRLARLENVYEPGKAAQSYKTPPSESTRSFRHECGRPRAELNLGHRS